MQRRKRGGIGRKRAALADAAQIGGEIEGRFRHEMFPSWRLEWMTARRPKHMTSAAAFPECGASIR
jgi:hypothetical protein